MKLNFKNDDTYVDSCRACPEFARKGHLFRIHRRLRPRSPRSAVPSPLAGHGGLVMVSMAYFAIFEKRENLGPEIINLLPVFILQ